MTDDIMEATRDLRTAARQVEGAPALIVKRWLRAGWADFKAHPTLSTLYGLTLAIIGWVTIWALAAMGQGWMILPMLAGAMLMGPAATVGLYRVSRRRMGKGGGGVAASGQIFLVSVVMMVLALAWIRSATLLFAVFFGLRPFGGLTDTLTTLFSTGPGIALFLVGSAVGGLFAALGFAVAAFSFPMLTHRSIDGFSAMGLSFNAVTQNFSLAITWAAVVSALIALSVLTGFLLLIPVFPLLGYATWHAYVDLFES